jgi:sec-independent protein translocase protein TatA
MPFNLGTTELIIILVIVIILFGAGRIGRLGADFGRAIREFRNSISDKDNPSSLAKEENSKNT